MENLRDRILRLACKDGGIDLSKGGYRLSISFDGPYLASDVMENPPANRVIYLRDGDWDYPIDRTVFWDTVDISGLLDATDGWIPKSDPKDGYGGQTSWRSVEAALYEMVGLKWVDTGNLMFHDVSWEPDFSDPAGAVYTVRDDEPVFHGQILIRGFRPPEVPGGEKLLRYVDSDYLTDADRTDPSVVGFHGYGDGVFSEVFPGVTHPILEAYRIKLTDRRKIYKTTMSNIGSATDQLPLMDFINGECVGLDYSNGVRSMRTNNSTGISYFTFKGVFAGLERLEGSNWVPATVDDLFANVPAELLDPGAKVRDYNDGDFYTMDMVDLVTKTSAGSHPRRDSIYMHSASTPVHMGPSYSYTETPTGLAVSSINMHHMYTLLKTVEPLEIEYSVYTPGLNTDAAMVGTLTPALRPAGPIRIVHRLVDPIYFPYDTLNGGQSYNISDLMQRTQWPMSAISSEGATGYFIEQMVPRHFGGSLSEPDTTYLHRKRLFFKNLKAPNVGTVLFRVIDEATGDQLGYYPHAATSNNDQ